MTKEQFLSGSALLLTVALVGCKGGGGSEESSTPSAPPAPKIKQFVPTADAGIPLSRTTKDNWKGYVASRNPYLGSRVDPMSLTSVEKQFEDDQQAERLAQNGFFGSEYAEPVPQQPEPVEPQPYRRLVGVAISNSIVALIDMGNGKTELIRPGQYVPGTEWFVVSIDEDKAVLRRTSRIQPREVVVRLEPAPIGSIASGAARPGGPPAGAPGAGPGGPGGPGGNAGRGRSFDD